MVKKNLRARDLFYAMWIPDLFMKRVESNSENWSLFSPDEAERSYMRLMAKSLKKLYDKV